ncbi:hypothetical protein COLU111180_19005 [Cohnella lubricantis]|nr:hypothetical protein [Cohnella lubricantis]
MFASLKRLFEDKCPVCSKRLIACHDSDWSAKACPDGHYKVENYGALGVQIVYDPSNPSGTPNITD